MKVHTTTNCFHLRAIQLSVKATLKTLPHLFSGVVKYVRNFAETFAILQSLRSKRANLKLILSIGGKSSAALGKMVSNHSARQDFVDSLPGKLRQWALDGLDIDFDPGVTLAYEFAIIPQLLTVSCIDLVENFTRLD